MTPDALEIALRHVAETKSLLESLITSSEAFDYPKAKLTLKALQKKTRELGKLKSELELEYTRTKAEPNVLAVSFNRRAAMTLLQSSP